jgi:hypothetical protein
VSLCAAFLTAARRVAKESGGWTDRACAVLGDGSVGYFVENFEGVMVWEGDAHCKYCARSEAIAAMANPDYAARIAEKIAKHGRPRAAVQS